jgi:uncharacterized RDD family membrane protein YckC
MEQTDAYHDELELEYCRASTSKRFANYIIDLIAFYLAAIFLVFVLEMLKPGIISNANIDGFADRLISLLLYGLVMFLVEAILQGKSLGKLITGTRAVNRNGGTPTLGQFLGRNFIRAVPFNAFSALGRPCKPWHDSGSGTIVIDEKLLALQQRKEAFLAELKTQTL